MTWRNRLEADLTPARKLRRQLRLIGIRRAGDVKLLVMIHPGRSGSTVLGSMLNQHPAIEWAREIFTRAPRNDIPFDDTGNILWRDHIETLLNRCNKPILGVEIKVHQIIKKRIVGADLEESLDRLSEAFDPELILLTRQNHLERWLSGATARETSRFHYREGDVAPGTKLPLPAEVKDHAYGLGKTEVNTWLDEVERINAAFVAAVDARGGLVLRYEDDILGDPEKGYRRILQFAGLPEVPSEPLYIKADRRPLDKRLSNFDELPRLLRAEHYERYCRS